MKEDVAGFLILFDIFTVFAGVIATFFVPGNIQIVIMCSVTIWCLLSLVVVHFLVREV